MRDWKAAAALEPVAGSTPEVSTLVYWARAIAHGHLHQAEAAEADLRRFDGLMAEVKKGQHSYMAEGYGPEIERDETAGWAAFAQNNGPEALKQMRTAANLQDKVGQGEVDIPAREMLADMLLELGQPKEALDEYAVALQLSPNRLNGLYNAGRAAEALGDKAKAQFYYSELLKFTNRGHDSERPELAHARTFEAAKLTSSQ
jgi:tetratricopeptide (TPR) repeat protein